MRHRQVFRQIRRVPVLVLTVVMLVLPLSSSTRAQIGGTIGYGSSVFGTLSAASQTLTYSFNGSAGDLVQVSSRNWTGTLDPQLSLVSPDGQTVATSTTNPFSEDSLEAALSLFLPQTGIYSLQVSGEDNTTGDFVLKLQGRSTVTATPLAYGQSVDVNIPANPPLQYFSFEVDTCPTVLTISNLSGGEPFTFPFVVKVRNQQGVQIAQLYGGDALEDRLILAPSSGRYEVTVSSDDPASQGTIRLLLSCTDQAPGCIPGSLAGETAGADRCPPCFGDEFGGELCDDFEIAVALDGGTAAFSWPAIEGAQWYIFSVIDVSGAMLLDSPVLLEGETTHSYTFNPADLGRGPFTAVVSAGTEDEGAGYLCVGDVVVSFDGEATDQCSGISAAVHVVPGAGRLAVLEWGAAPGAAAYTIHVYAYDPGDGGLIGIRVFTAPGDATTYHLEGVFPSDYERFHIEIRAYSEASGGGAFGDLPQGYLCGGSADVEFEPTGPVHWGPAA